MPSLYETTATVGDVSSSNFTTLYNASGLTVPNAGAGAVTGNLNVSGNLTVQGTSLLIGGVTLQSTLTLPNYTFPLPDGTTDQVLVTDGSGNLYWTDVTAIPGAAYSLEANTTTGGAYLTLHDSGGGNDNVKLAAGSNMSIVRTDANTITISTVADNIPDGTADGQVLVWESSAWTASPFVKFTDRETGRLKFVNSDPASISSIEILKDIGSSIVDGDSSAELFGVTTSDYVTRKYNHRLTSEYDSGGNNAFLIQTDPIGNFSNTSTTIFEQLYVDSNGLAINGNSFEFLTNSAGTPANNATISVNRGTETDATLIWNETTDGFEFNFDVTTPGLIAGNVNIGIVNNQTISTGSGDLVIIPLSGSKVNITSDLSTDPTTITRTTANTNTSTRAVTLKTDSTGTPAVGFGAGIEYQVETAVNTFKQAAIADVVSTDITPGSEDFNYRIFLMENGGSLSSPQLVLTSTGNLSIANDVTIANDLAVNGGDITTTATTANVFNANATTVNIANAATTVSIGATTGVTGINNDLQVHLTATDASIAVGSQAVISTIQTITTSTSPVSITFTGRDSMNGSVTIKDNVTNALHTVNFTALRNGATAMLTTYGELYTSAALANFTVDVSAGNVRLLATPASANNTTFNVVRTSLY